MANYDTHWTPYALPHHVGIIEAAGCMGITPYVVFYTPAFSPGGYMQA